MLKDYIGNRRFYKLLMAVVLPIMAQNGITQFVNMIDNVMVGRLGTEQMSGVAIVNQLMFVFNLCVFGGMAGAGIFTAQFFGKKDDAGIRSTVRFKLITAIVITAVSLGIFITLGDTLVRSFLQDSDSSGDLELAFKCGMDYLKVIMLTVPLVTLTQVYASTLYETGKTLQPMVASFVAVLVNLSLNYVLIYGKLGFPELGVVGAALATLIARITECIYLVIFSHRKKNNNTYLKGVFSSLKVEKTLAKKILIKGSPLLFNELLWATGMTMLAQAYSTRGIEAVAAYNISNTISNLFGVVFISMGSAVAIMLGQQLGAGDIEGAKSTQKKLAFVSVTSSVVTALLMIALSSVFPLAYETTDNVREIASKLIIVAGLWMPLNGYVNLCYFTLRSGGKVIITFLFDSLFVWSVAVPLAIVLSRYTSLDIVTLYALCVSVDIIKCITGAIFVKSGKWAKNIVV